jgi:hypothetical protein
MAGVGSATCTMGIGSRQPARIKMQITKSGSRNFVRYIENLSFQQ